MRRIKPDWTTYLHSMRKREIDTVFSRFPSQVFSRGLEIGAGDGYQSTLLTQYIQHLIAIDLNPERLQKESSDAVEYKICDAENIGEILHGQKFDIIFSSNLLEHVPEPQRVLRGTRTLLTEDGITINIMPGAWMELLFLLGHIPNQLVIFFEKLTQSGAWMKIKNRLGRKIKDQSETETNQALMQRYKGNNLKTAREKQSKLKRLLVPKIHGISKSHFHEIWEWRRRRWLNEFTDAGFQPIVVMRGPVVSGYGFGFDILRNILEAVGFTTHHIYICKKTGSASKHERYFKNQKSNK
ncbi:MAG: class I SAM-dependent methyltransferase [bacterium]